MARHHAMLLVALSAGCVQERPPAAVDTDRILAADSEPGNWLTHGRTYDEQRFSPLRELDTANVAGLGLAWSYQLRTGRGASATPLVVDGVIYLTSAWSLVYALDAGTGAERWVYDPRVEHAVGAKACCDVINRGVAVYGGKVYVGVIDGRLVALDARDGSVVWERMTVDSNRPYTITGAPRAAHGLVFIGNGGAEYGVRGYVTAYDAETGDLRWRFYTVPGDPAAGPDGAASDSILAVAAATWTGRWWELGGGGTVWDAIVYDAAFDQLLIGVGNGSPWNQRVRSPGGGDNLFLTSIVALDAQTGRYKWHYQTTPGETWDYTATQPIILADLGIGGTQRQVAMQAPKNGFFYVIDRANGKLISAQPFVPLEPERETPPGAPISWAYAVDTTTGRPIENPSARYPRGTVVVRPSPFGAHNWHPMSYSPLTGLVYIPAQEMAFDFTHDAGFTARAGLWNTGLVMGAVPVDPQVPEALRSSTQGMLLAWDPVAQREVWRAPRLGAWNGGTLATAGGLVFQGTVDGRFLAMHAGTGAELWSYDTRAATLAGPVAYQAGGEQYVAVLGGYGSAFFLIGGIFAPRDGDSLPGRVYAFKRGGTAPAPVPAFEPLPPPAAVEVAATPAEVARGAALYAQFCIYCHGIGTVAGGVLPDLRRSSRLADSAAWHRVVVDAERAAGGMPGYAAHFGRAESNLIRAYVARQSALLRAATSPNPSP